MLANRRGCRLPGSRCVSACLTNEKLKSPPPPTKPVGAGAPAPRERIPPVSAVPDSLASRRRRDSTPVPGGGRNQEPRELWWGPVAGKVAGPCCFQKNDLISLGVITVGWEGLLEGGEGGREGRRRQNRMPIVCMRWRTSPFFSPFFFCITAPGLVSAHLKLGVNLGKCPASPWFIRNNNTPMGAALMC